MSAAMVTCTPFRDDAADSGGDGASAGQGDTSGAEAGPPCRADTPFGDPTPVLGLSDFTADSIGGLRLSSDYLRGYFHAEGHLPALGNNDIFAASRRTTTSPFEGFMLIAGHGVNTVGEDDDPTISGDALTLIFTSSVYVGTPMSLFRATRPTA